MLAFVLRGQLSHLCQLHCFPWLVSSCFLVLGFSCSICLSCIEFQSVIDNDGSVILLSLLLMLELVYLALQFFWFFWGFYVLHSGQWSTRTNEVSAELSSSRLSLIKFFPSADRLGASNSFISIVDNFRWWIKLWCAVPSSPAATVTVRLWLKFLFQKWLSFPCFEVGALNLISCFYYVPLLLITFDVLGLIT